MPLPTKCSRCNRKFKPFTPSNKLCAQCTKQSIKDRVKATADKIKIGWKPKRNIITWELKEIIPRKVG